MNAIRHIHVIARMEFRFGFRRGAPVMVMGIISLLIGAGILVAPLVSLSSWSASTIMTPEKVERLASFGLSINDYSLFLRDALGDMFVSSTLLAWFAILLALLFLPIATSASLPADRKFGVSDLLRSTPITGFEYLAGKILGLFSAVLLVGVVGLSLFFIVAELTLLISLHFGLSSNAILFLIKLALLDGLPILAWATAVGVLAGVFFHTRRAAVFPALLAGIASVVGWIIAFKAPSHGIIGGMTDLVHYYLVQNYHSSALALEARLGGQDGNLLNLAGAPQVTVGQLALMYLAIIASFAILFGLARLWLHWKENF